MFGQSAELLLRSAELADIPAIAAIYAEAVRSGTATFELEPPGEAEMARRLSELRDGGFPYVVARIGSRIVGYAYAGPYRTRPAYAWTVEDSIYIGRDWQGRGVGRALLSAVIDEAEATGFRQMIAVITEDASSGSIPLHRALGFAYVGTLGAVGWKHDRWLATIIMQRPLGESDRTAPV